MNNSTSVQESLLEQRVARLEREKAFLHHQVRDLQQINTKLNSETNDLKKTKRDLYKKLNVAQKSDVVKKEGKEKATKKEDNKDPLDSEEALSRKPPAFDMHSTNWPSLAGAMAGR